MDCIIHKGLHVSFFLIQPVCMCICRLVWIRFLSECVCTNVRVACVVWIRSSMLLHYLISQTKLHSGARCTFHFSFSDTRRHAHSHTCAHTHTHQHQTQDSASPSSSFSSMTLAEPCRVSQSLTHNSGLSTPPPHPPRKSLFAKTKCFLGHSTRTRL